MTETEILEQSLIYSFEDFLSSRAQLNIEGIKTETDDEDGPLPSNLRECIRPKNQISENLDKSTSTDPTLSNDAQLKYENNQLKLALELRYFFKMLHLNAYFQILYSKQLGSSQATGS